MSAEKKKPIACIVIGMAGSGKTTFMQRLGAHVHEHTIPSYVINLDPAVNTVPYAANIDIRDTVNYKQVMKQYNLGPNGGILTSLNLFATRFDQVMTYIENKTDVEYIFVDTPGQIEIFTWSASGQVISESLASTFPTVIVYVIDTPRNTSPVTFMSNMLYACSILYKTRLPFVIVFNKIDVVRHDFATKWMQDYEAFNEALSSDQSYSSTLANSLSLSLDEFYRTISCVGVSAVTGEGINEFLSKIQLASQEYNEEYLAELSARKEKVEQIRREKQEDDLRRVEQDTADEKDGKTKVVSYQPTTGKRVVLNMNDDEDREEEEALKRFLNKQN
ncbi:GPN-loop GTPase [Acrasis kona]|uniref:GPN-loop GTPase n=1 Tax=Acrasis kona TaxID=1008807 RepID=A0AAW2YN58_9EUKA